MEFEDILKEVGDYGKYQRDIIYFFLIPAASLLPWFSMNIFFMVSVPDHWCYVPEIASSNMSIAQQRSLISPENDSSCRMYDVNYTELLASQLYVIPNDTATKPCSHGWQYDTTNYEYTAASQWNMVCDNAHYPSLVLTLYNVGSILGTPIYGVLSDKIGRKPVFFIVIIVTAITAFCSVVMKNFTAFVAMKTINGSLMPSVFQLPYIIILEIVGPKMRTRMNGIVNSAWTLGLCLLPLVAYLSRNWVIFGLITSAATLVYFCYWNLLPESPRWLLSQEKYTKAVKIMQDIGKKNSMLQDKDVITSKMQKLGEKINKEKEIDGVKNGPTDLLKYPQLRKKFFIITFCWIADITAYYGLQLNVANLAGNEFLNFFFLAVVEFPGYLASWVFMEKFGRRWCTVSTLTMTAVCCFLPAIIPSSVTNIGVASSLLAKFFTSAAFMSTYQQSSELYPTTVRGLGMGMSGVIAAAVTFAVPYIVFLSMYGESIPFLVIGFTNLMAGFSAIFLPETLNENLPQTISDAEQFGLNQKFFSFNKKKRESYLKSVSSLNIKKKIFSKISRKISKEKDNAEAEHQVSKSVVLQEVKKIPVETQFLELGITNASFTDAEYFPTESKDDNSLCPVTNNTSAGNGSIEDDLVVGHATKAMFSESNTEQDESNKYSAENIDSACKVDNAESMKTASEDIPRSPENHKKAREITMDSEREHNGSDQDLASNSEKLELGNTYESNQDANCAHSYSSHDVLSTDTSTQLSADSTISDNAGYSDAYDT